MTATLETMAAETLARSLSRSDLADLLADDTAEEAPTVEQGLESAVTYLTTELWGDTDAGHVSTVTDALYAAALELADREAVRAALRQVLRSRVEMIVVEW